MDSVMDDSEDKVYKYKLFKDNPPTICSRIGSCLYTYTIGSCLYFTNADAPDQKANMKIIELKSMTSTDKKNSKSVLEEDNNVDNEWKKKTARKAADCKMKKRIQHHFKDHVKRWLDSHRRRFPWKLILHLLLVAVVTTQVSLYAIERRKMTSFLIDGNTALKHYFIDADHHSSNGKSAVRLYKIDEIYDQIESIVENQSNLQSHIDAFHEGHRPFKCTHDGCTSTFAFKHCLLRHLKLHMKGRQAAKKRPRRPLSSKLSGFVIKRVPDQEPSVVHNGVHHSEDEEETTANATPVRNQSSP